MSNPDRIGSGSYGVLLRRSILLIALVAAPASRIYGQDHDEDHDHGDLDFSHPLVTESPTPDTKIRFDFAGSRTAGPANVHENVFRLEGEYAFNHAVSIAIVTPFVSRTAPTSDRASNVGNVEISLKGASLVLGEHGVLIGGGMSAELPTGNEAKGIGSSHILELEPFVDIAYKQRALELVGFTTLSSAFRRREGEEAERNLAVDLSALYHIHPRLETLIELTNERALVGAESGAQQTFVAPGVKVYPFTNRHIMFGASLEVGLGMANDTRTLLLSAFYHF
jgi:hypothetical protein